jgi:hypothetical protein
MLARGLVSGVGGSLVFGGCLLAVLLAVSGFGLVFALFFVL